MKGKEGPSGKNQWTEHPDTWGGGIEGRSLFDSTTDCSQAGVQGSHFPRGR